MESSSSPFFRLFRDYIQRHKWSYISGSLCLWLTNYLTVSIPGLIGSAIDALRADQLLAVGRNAGLIACFGAAIIVVRTLSRVLIFNPARDIEYRLRQDIFSRLMEQQPSFYASRKAGDLMSRATNDLRLVRAMAGFGGLQIFNVVFAVSLTGWKMLQLSPRLSLLSLIPILVATISVHLGISRFFGLMKKNQVELAEIGDHILGSLRGIATLQGFAAEEVFIKRLDEKNIAWFRTGMKLSLLRALVVPLLGLGAGVAVYVILSVGGGMVLDGALTVGDVAAFTALLAAIVSPLRSMGWMLAVVQQGQVGLERIFEILDAPVEKPEGLKSLQPTAGRGPAISIKNLTFAYPGKVEKSVANPEREPNDPVLKDVSVEIPAGASVGVCGRTGSGKSTLVQVLARLYNPPPGTIFIDGVDLTQIDLASWRERLSVVPQRPFLFSETIEENVALSDHPDLDRARRAVKTAELEADLAALPKGIHTLVGERGVILSGGQRQRVALARGFYRRGDLIVLDDVLSAVDHGTEHRLLDALAGLGRDERKPTIIITSHRLSAIRNADLILVFDGGRLVDKGTHEELLSRSGMYGETWQLQRNQEELSPKTAPVESLPSEKLPSEKLQGEGARP